MWALGAWTGARRRVLPAGSVGQKASGLPLRLIKRQQLSVLTYGQSLGLTPIASAILDDVAPHTSGLDPDAEAGEGGVPHYELRRARLYSLHTDLGGFWRAMSSSRR